MSRIWDWLTGRKSIPHIEVVLYTREGCHLCDIALEQLETAQKRCGFRLTLLDVDASMESKRQFGESVPVVVVNGKVRFRGRINEVLLTRLLEVESGKGSL